MNKEFVRIYEYQGAGQLMKTLVLLLYKSITMKKITLALLLLSASFLSAQTKGDIMDQIKEYKKQLVIYTFFDKPETKVWQGMYAAVASVYQINKESESRGYIEGYKEDEFSKETISVQILSKTQPFEISVSIVREERTKNYQTNAYSEWKPAASSFSTENSIYNIRTKIYETIMGPIELTPELQKLVDDFNAKQDKERKKLKKGVHY